MAILSPGPRFIFGNFWAAVFSGVVSAASVGVEDEDGTVFEGDFDWLSGCEALVEQVETRLRIVVWDPFADGLPGWFDGLEGFDVEGRVRRWREVDDAPPTVLGGGGRMEPIRACPFVLMSLCAQSWKRIRISPFVLKCPLAP